MQPARNETSEPAAAHTTRGLNAQLTAAVKKGAPTYQTARMR
jgi:hypothetical protein